MRRSHAITLCLALLSFVSPRPAAAQSWTSLGPTNLGGPVTGIVIDPAAPTHLVVSGAGGGIWRSLDGGATWTPVGDALPSLAVWQVVAHPTHAGEIFATTAAGLFKSTDAGATWGQIGSFVPKRLAIAPDGLAMLATTTAPSGTYRSVDQGLTWTAVLSQETYDVAFNPANPQSAFSAVSLELGKFLAFSANAGQTWSQSDGVPNGFNNFPRDTRFAFSMSSPSSVYAVVKYATNTDVKFARVLRSNDGGASFSVLAGQGLPPLGEGINSLSRLSLWVDPTNPNVIVVGLRDLWRSIDGGATFSAISDWSQNRLVPGGQQNTIVADPGFNGTSNRRVFVGTEAGLFRADDIAAVTSTSGWTSLNAGLVLGATDSVAALWQGPVLGVAPTIGVLNLPAGASTAFLTAPASALPDVAGAPAGQIAGDPENAAPVFYLDALAHAAYRSTDGGATFSPLTTPSASRLARPPVAGTAAVFGQTGLYRTSDSASPTPTWQQLQSQWIDDAAFVQGHPEQLWLVTHAGGRVLASPNANDASPVFGDITPISLVNKVRRAVPASADGSVGYIVALVGAEWQIWRTDSGSWNWNNASIPGAVINVLAVHPANPLVVFAGTETGVYQSSDGGAHWTFISPNHAAVTDLSWQNKRLVVATRGRGLWAIDISGQPTTFIDTPTVGASVTQPFVISGWAIDTAAATGTGVDSVHIYAVPTSPAGPAIFLGSATVGLGRPDLAVAFGARFGASGYSQVVTGLAPGAYQLVVYAHSAFSDQFSAAVSSFTVGASTRVVVDVPTANASMSQPLPIVGWAFDPAATAGIGVDRVDVWAIPVAQGPAQFLGSATLGVARPDVAAAFGAQFANSGFQLVATGLAPGAYQLVVYARSTVSLTFTATVVPIQVTSGNVVGFIDSPSANAVVAAGSIVRGWAADLSAASGTGIGAVHVWAVPVGGGAATFVGVAEYGLARPDVGAAFGGQFTNSGYALALNGLQPGAYDLVVFFYSSVTQTFAPARVVRITLDTP